MNFLYKYIMIKQVFYFLVLALLVFCRPTPAGARGAVLALGTTVAGSRSITQVVSEFLLDAGIRITEHNEMTLLESGKEKFEDLFRHIRDARHHIHLEYFNFRNDSISTQLFDLLAHKAAEGVEVRALFDAFGNMSNDSPLKDDYLDSLRTRGIQIHKYDPIRFPWINHIFSRDHRKVVVIDGIYGYLGGMNIADYYINGTPKVGEWRDMHCRITGDAVKDLQVIFADMWHQTTQETIGGAAYFPELPPDSITQPLSLAIVDRKPSEQPSTLRDAYALSITEADSIVRIVNPYFVPTRSITKAIKDALVKGVDVHIMVSSRSDIPFTPDAMLHKLRKLAKRGAKVHLYTKGFHHAKIMTVDGELSTLGSLNLNSRSLRYDYETNVFIFDRAQTTKLDSLFVRDQASCILLDDSYWKKRSLWRKFVGWFANLFTPFL